MNALPNIHLLYNSSLVNVSGRLTSKTVRSTLFSNRIAQLQEWV